MKPRVVVLGAGFGGLEVTSLVSEALGDRVELTLIDQWDSFVFGYSKLDVMFGLASPESVRLPYAKIAKPGVRVVRETITEIDPIARKVTTNQGQYEADQLVVALGADYDCSVTPGLRSGRDEFYSVEGAEYLRGAIPNFTKGSVVIGVCGPHFKCPPAPSEAVLLFHDYLQKRGVRGNCEVTLVTPMSVPVPPSPDTSKALIAAFAERGIKYLPSKQVTSLDATRQVVVLDDGSEVPCTLFLGVPKHRCPKVVLDSPLGEGHWIQVDPATLETKFPNVYACGDVANQMTPKAGVFAEGAAKTVGAAIVAKLTSGDRVPHLGRGSCYVEFGGGKIGRVDVDFFSGPKPTGTFQTPSLELRAEKSLFGSSRRARWFGL